jgi:hypothetical protein
MFGTSVLYLAVVFLLRGWMRSREAFVCAGAMRIHNVIQVVVCSYMSYGLLTALWQAEPLVLYGIRGKLGAGGVRACVRAV